MTPGPDCTVADAIAKLFNPGMGTQHVASFGVDGASPADSRGRAGYTSLFLLDALSKAAQDQRDDQSEMRNDSRHARLLNPTVITRDYAPLMIGIDDFSYRQSHCADVQAAAESLGLSPFLKLMTGNFRDAIPRITPDDLRLDMIWLDCGGTPDQADFLSLCRPRRGSI